MKQVFETKPPSPKPQDIETSKKESLFFENKTEEEVRRLAPEYFAKKMEEKGMTKDHLCYIFLSPPEDMSLSFIQGYATYETTYFSEPDYDINNLKMLEEIIDNFDYERDKDKNLPTTTVRSKTFKDIHLN